MAPSKKKKSNPSSQDIYEVQKNQQRKQEVLYGLIPLPKLPMKSNRHTTVPAPKDMEDWVNKDVTKKKW